MIRSHRSFFALIFGIALFSLSPVYAYGQTEKPAPDKEEIAALREKAFKLLESVASQLDTLQSTENRARMGANLFDSLWKRDEERARSLLRLVQDDIKAELQKPEPEDSRFGVFLKLRNDTVERIAKYDGLAALDFLKATHPVFEKDEEPYNFQTNEQALELRLARQIAADNPDVALKLGREALEGGFSKDLLLLLEKLNRKHRDRFQVLYKAVLEKLSTTEFLDDWQVRNFASTLVRGFRPPDVDESAYRELVGIFVTTALSRGCAKKSSMEEEGAQNCRWLGGVIAGAASYDPRAAGLKQWTSDGEQAGGAAFAYERLMSLLEEGEFDQLETLASKHPQLQATMYTQAIYQLLAVGKMDEARKMLDRVPMDPERRQWLLAVMDGSAKKPVVTDEELAEVNRRLEELPSTRRAQFLLEVANEFRARDRKLAMKLLAQAGEVIDNMEPGKSQTERRVVLATLYCLEKNDRGFAIMESLVPKLNELVDIAVKLNGYDTNYLRDGEWNMSANGSVGAILTQLSQHAGDFAWFNFDRAVTLAAQFERPEIRMMAHLKLAQSILEGQKRPGFQSRFYISVD